MAKVASLLVQLGLEDNQLKQDLVREDPRFATSVLKREFVTLTLSAFTALSPPTGAQLLVMIFPSTVLKLTLKGVTGDTGIPIVPTSNSNCPLVPLVLPLGTTPSLGIANGHSADQIVECVWL